MYDRRASLQLPRRAAAARRRGARTLNGIDYVEVSDDQRDADGASSWARRPRRSAHRPTCASTGGSQVRDIEVVDVHLCRQDDPELDDCLKVIVDRPGDFSIYTLRLVESTAAASRWAPLHGFDPRYAALDFSFKVGCPSDLDCAPAAPCPPSRRATSRRSTISPRTTPASGS